MVDALVKEIEEPLITGEELAIHLGMTSKIIVDVARRLKIKNYTIREGNYYKNAYDEKMVRQIIDELKKKNAVIRKNKLDIGKLL